MANLQLGPQYEKDDPFRARMRLHQSWYRAEVLSVPWGRGPTHNSARELGSMLDAEAPDTGLNFLLRPEIHHLALKRIAQGGGAVDEYRLLYNLLSSQPMCFNLFGPLGIDLDLCTRFLRVAVGEQVRRASHVAIEWAPDQPSEYLDDLTAFDAFIEYETDDGLRGFVGIETKLTESFSKQVYDTPAYRRWVEDDRSPWPESAWARLQERDHNQLWRDHLLAVAMLLRDDHYSEGQLWLVSHSLDTVCKTAAKTYRSLLEDGCNSYRELRIDQVVELISKVASSDAERGWLRDFRTRYVDLGQSEPYAATV